MIDNFAFHTFYLQNGKSSHALSHMSTLRAKWGPAEIYWADINLVSESWYQDGAKYLQPGAEPLKLMPMLAIEENYCNTLYEKEGVTRGSTDSEWAEKEHSDSFIQFFTHLFMQEI